jgi:hypothetical protein
MRTCAHVADTLHYSYLLFSLPARWGQSSYCAHSLAAQAGGTRRMGVNASPLRRLATNAACADFRVAPRGGSSITLLNPYHDEHARVRLQFFNRKNGKLVANTQIELDAQSQVTLSPGHGLPAALGPSFQGTVLLNSDVCGTPRFLAMVSTQMRKGKQVLGLSQYTCK